MKAWTLTCLSFLPALSAFAQGPSERAFAAPDSPLVGEVHDGCRSLVADGPPRLRLRLAMLTEDGEELVRAEGLGEAAVSHCGERRFYVLRVYGGQGEVRVASSPGERGNGGTGSLPSEPTLDVSGHRYDLQARLDAEAQPWRDAGWRGVETVDAAGCYALLGQGWRVEREPHSPGPLRLGPWRAESAFCVDEGDVLHVVFGDEDVQAVSREGDFLREEVEEPTPHVLLRAPSAPSIRGLAERQRFLLTLGAGGASLNREWAVRGRFPDAASRVRPSAGCERFLVLADGPATITLGERPVSFVGYADVARCGVERVEVRFGGGDTLVQLWRVQP